MTDASQTFASVAAELGVALESAGFRYFVGGSVASSFHGIPRMTNDVDVVVELMPADVPRLTRALGPDFDVNEEALADAARARRGWNIFHTPTATKIDVFIARGDAFDQSRFARCMAVEPKPGQRVFVSSPEDTVLRKLLWYRQRGSQSQRQWQDVLEVLRMQRGQLDETYLDEWAATLGIADLLAQARADRRIDL